jgi:tetratricopeptide (TPR) repeat protein
MENWFDRKKVVVLSVLIAVAGVGTYFYQSVSETKEQEGKSALYKVQKTFEEESKAIPESEKTAGAALDVDTKFSKTVSELNGLLKARTANNRILYEAAYRLGTLYLDYRQPEKAAQSLKEGVSFAKAGIQKASIQYLLGSALEQASKAKEALGVFQEGLSQNVSALKGEFLLGMMRMHLQLKEVDKAKKLSEQITKELSGSKSVDIANQLLKDAK